MLNIKELNRSLSKDGINLSDKDCEVVKTFMIRLATIEYEFYRSQKIRSSEDGKVIKMPEIGSDIEFQNDIKIAS